MFMINLTKTEILSTCIDLVNFELHCWINYLLVGRATKSFFISDLSSWAAENSLKSLFQYPAWYWSTCHVSGWQVSEEGKKDQDSALNIQRDT